MTAPPAPPGPRLAWDTDWGSVVYGSTGAPLSAGDKAILNDESDSSIGPITDNIVFLLPASNFDKVSVVGFWVSSGDTYADILVSYSNDTTTGADGTWHALGNLSNNAFPGGGGFYPVRDVYRWGVSAWGIGSVAGFRLEFPTSQEVRAIHLYGVNYYSFAGGDGSEAVTFAGLGLLGNGLDDALDFGAMAQDSSAGDSVTLSNNSPLTAHAVVVSVDAPLTDAGVPLRDQVYLSADDGATWHGELALGDMVTQAQQDIAVRWFARHDADLGDWTVRLLVDATGGYS